MSGPSLYLGRTCSPETLEPGSDLALVDADRLTRHAVCLGMTGSGKTGLCVTLLEELAMAGVPVIVIDPKGDMANLALAFKNHEAADFAPWVDPGAARRAGKTVEAYAEGVAAMWKKGLADWGVDAARISALSDNSKVSIYTPGSDAGIPVNVLSSLDAPTADLLSDDEGLRDLVSGTVGSLLGLVGIEADPVNDATHIVLSRILGDAWAAGESASMELLITRLVDPPFDKVGVFPVDTFFPRKQRMTLAMQLNGIVASPAFGAWRRGVALDIDALLDRSGSKTPVQIFYTAHLDDAQRMFFTSTLLNRMVAWSRRQPGTGSLRALLYFDEVFGYLPPHPKNPPTKRAVLTLMKQARAVGLGTMLVTQNPVDVDYKAMSNAGSWFIGRLQTKQDQQRVLDGLAGASGAFDRQTVSGWLESLPPRTFIHRDVKEDAPRLLHSRWAISYLRGPLTRSEVERLDQDEPVAAAPTAAPAVGTRAPSAPVTDDETAGYTANPPPAPAGYEYRFLDPSVVFSHRLAPFFEERAQPRRSDGQIVWEAALHAKLHLRFDEGREYMMEREEHRLFFPIDDHEIRDCGEPDLQPRDFLPSAPPDSRFARLPGLIDEARELKVLEKRVIEDVYRGETDKLFRQKAIKLDSLAGETREQFNDRLKAAIQDLVDKDVAKLKTKVDRDVTRIEEKLRTLERNKDRYESDARAQMATEVVNFGETIFGMFFGGRKKSLTTVASKRQSSMRAKERLSRTEGEITDLQREMFDIESETSDRIREIEVKHARLADDVEEVEVRLERNDIRLDEFGIVWVPVTRAV